MASSNLTGTHERRRPPPIEVLPALCAVIDHLPVSVFLLAGDSRVLFYNRGAQALLDSPGNIKFRRGRLLIGDTLASDLATTDLDSAPAYRRKIAFLSASANPRDGSFSGHGIHIAKLSLRRKTDPVAFMLFASATGRQVCAQTLRHLYRLTHAEAATAAQLFAGQRPAEVATRLKVSTHTVRSHMKRIFAKCAVSSQIELVKLLALGPAVL